MRTQLGLLVTLLVVSISSLPAQSLKREPFWVVEGNTKNPTYTILRFYDSEAKLLKEERLEGKFLDIRKRKNRVFMERKLAVITRYTQNWAMNTKMKD